MAVNLEAPAAADLLPVPGIDLAVASAGVKPGSQAGERDDLMLLTLAPGSRVAAVFTRSAFPAACVTVAKAHLAAATPRALLVNSGNANCATGQAGQAAAAACCAEVARQLGCTAAEVLPFSTGVIGEPLPVPAMLAAVPALVAGLAPDNWLPAAAAIMTTDTVAKVVSLRLPTPLGHIVITGMAKGSGMIQPDMATMLAYLGTNAALPTAALQPLLQRVADRSFNRITVDSDTSTNDALLLAASGVDGDLPDGGMVALEEGLVQVARELALQVVRDGEGATKLVTVQVGGAADDAAALQVARSIANSPLVKTALFAADPNWGRLVMAIGKAGVPVDPDQVAVQLIGGGQQVPVAAAGQLVADYSEAAAAAAMAASEVTVQVGLGGGSGAATVWTSDLSYEYVRINAEYRS